MKTIFVYGTLKRGGTNHHFLAGQQFLGEASTESGFVLYLFGDYPAMVRSAEADTAVHGEIWSVDATCLAALDDLEGVAEGLYERAVIPLASPSTNQSAETYLYLRSVVGAPLIGGYFRT